MNNFLKILSVIIAASIPGVAFAEIAGFVSPLPVGADVLTGLFAAVAIVAFAVNDYSRAARSLHPVAKVCRICATELGADSCVHNAEARRAA